MEDEEQLLGLVTLAVQDIVVVEGVHLESGDEINQEVLGLVLEELD